MEKVIKLFSALSDETRLRIYLLLLEKKLCVCELVSILNIEQSRISHSLKNLKEAGLVNNEREGKWIIYSVNPKTIKNKIIQGLKKDISLSVNDSQKLAKCKKNNIREKCIIRHSNQS